jgi:signal transduction histidine kinase
MTINAEIQGATLLIVDDNPTNLSVLCDYFQEYAFNVIAARSGVKALQVLEKRRPDMILLDILMPEIDGFEVCRRLKQQDHTEDIPVIFMSALTEVVDKLKGFEVGGVDYITKPFQREEVLARVSAHLMLRYQQRQLQAKNQHLQTTLKRLHKTQTQLLESKQMAALGQLADGIAHEINSPASTIANAVTQIDEIWGKLAELLNVICAADVPEDVRAAYLATYRQVLAFRPELSMRERRSLAQGIRTKLQSHNLDVGRKMCVHLASFGFTADNLAPILSLFNRPEFVQMYDSLRLMSKHHSHVRAIASSIEQIIQLVNTLRQYSHLDEDRVVETRLPDDLNNTLRLLRRQLQHIRVQTEYAPHIPGFRCYASRLNQVWMHLLQNAIQALDGEGAITVRLDFPARQEIVVEIEDSGPGIPVEIRDKIFEPYFTTRSQDDKRIGMGLNVCRDIVEQHQGRIELAAAEPGRTCFRVTLPLRNTLA